MTGTVEFNPFATVGVGERHDVYESLARTGPVHRITLPTGAQAWLVTGYAQVRAVLNDPRLLKAPSPGPSLVQKLRPDLFRAAGTPALRRDGA